MAQPLFKIRLFYPSGIFKSNFKDVSRLRNQRRLNPYLYMDLSKSGLYFYHTDQLPTAGYMKNLSLCRYDQL